jgi:hypothetical protein
MERFELNKQLLDWIAKCAAATAGATWTALSIMSIASDDWGHTLNVLIFVPLALTFTAVTGLTIANYERMGNLARAGFALSIASFLPILVGQLAVVTDRESLEWLGFPVGVLTWAVGFGMLGVGLVRGGILPHRAGYAIAAAQPAAMITGFALSPIWPLQEYGGYTGAIAHGVIWLGVAWALHRQAEMPPAGAPAPQAI